MQQSKSRNLNIILILTVVFVVLAVGLFCYLQSRGKHIQQQHLQLVTERYQHAYNTIYDQYGKLARTLYSEFMSGYEVHDVYQKLLSADEGQKNTLRTELLRQIKPRYEELSKVANIRILHFYLADNESFLRFQRPEKYGDDITEIRQTVTYVNREHRAIDGFEVGRLYSAYRFVFPITAPDKTHLGCMEISFGPEVITSAMMNQYPVWSNFLIKKSIINQKVLLDDSEENYRQAAHEYYLYDINVLAVLEKVSQQKIHNVQPQKNIADKFHNIALMGRAMSIYTPAIDKVITSIPVLNPASGENVAFLMVRSKTDFFTQQIEQFRVVFVLSVTLLAMVLFTFYQQYSKRKTLEVSTEQLHVQQRRLLEAQKIANLGHWEHDLSTNRVSWSEQVYRIFDLQPEEFAGSFESFLDLVHPRDRGFVAAFYADSVETRKTFDVQHRIICKDGVEKWVREICTTEYDLAGKPLRSLGIVHDITKQHNALTYLQQERDMFMHGPVMTFTWQNSENWPVKHVSGNVTEILGFSAMDFLTSSVEFNTLIHKDDLKRVTAEVATGIANHKSFFIHEPYRLKTKSGGIVWVLDTTTLLRDEQNQVSHFQGYLVDITSTVKIEEKIFEAKDRLEFIIEAANLGTWDWNVQTGEMLFNERWCEMLGYTKAEMKPRFSTWETIVHPDDIAEVTIILTDHLEGRIPVFMSEHRLLHKSGKWVWVLDVGKVVRRDADGKPLRVVGIHFDITSRKEQEEARLHISQKEEELKRFESLKTMAGAIAHRFNNAMMGVLGNLELMIITLDKGTDEYEMAISAAQAATGASQVGSMMLSYVGQRPLQLQDVLLADLARESVTALKDIFLPEISVKFKPPAQPICCSLDGKQIKEVIEGVLTNAVEALANNAGTVEISFGVDSFVAATFPIPFQDHLKDGKYAFCQIKDSGHGIDPENLSRIFEPFYTTRFVGRGLGLALCVGIMRAHHGAILVESSPGSETTVRILFPHQKASPPVLSLAEKEASHAQPVSGTILLADDEEMVLGIERQLLTTVGFTVYTAINGQEAVDLVRQGDIHFSVIILDISMPEMDGIEAMKEIRKIDSSLPIILCSGYSEETFHFAENPESKPDGFLGKPFQLADLIVILEKLGS